MRKAVEKILREEIGVREGEGILVGVSGGPDSVALLHLLRETVGSGTLHAAHLDHALRGRSAEDARFVEELCRAWGVPLVSKRVDVRSETLRRGTGIEEGARMVRRECLEEAAEAAGCRWIALGHHRGDQAETIVHRLLRGSAVSGLAGMTPRAGRYIRPLLAFSRAQILNYLTKHDLCWREDETNADPSYTRNRLRHEVLPLLTQFNPRLEEHLLRLGRRIALEEDFWRGEEERALASLRTWVDGGSELDGAALLRLHPALRIRVLRRAAEEVRGGLAGIGAVHLEALGALLEGARPQAELHLPGLRVMRRYHALSLRRVPGTAPEPFCLTLQGPGECLLPDGRILSARWELKAAGESRDWVEFDAERVAFPLTIRSFHPGDRFHPCGAPGGKKLKDFFIDRKIASELRRRLPLVVADEILWIVGVRRCEGRRPAGRPVLRLGVTPARSEDY